MTDEKWKPTPDEVLEASQKKPIPTTAELLARAIPLPPSAGNIKRGEGLTIILSQNQNPKSQSGGFSMSEEEKARARADAIKKVMGK